MGSSSRPNNYDYNFTPEESIQYFNDYLERWRVAMGDIRDFYLVGHSFGSYLVANYAAKYPQYVRKLVLLSPIGTKEIEDEVNHELLKRMRDFKGTKPSRIMQFYAKKSFRYKIMPFTHVRFFGKTFSW